ncbi:hypothetical protein CVS40_5984 [Lucilia cuprina]|nr:hypothetical protein CVS40_5984 [Lucilia cuprina]
MGVIFVQNKLLQPEQWHAEQISEVSKLSLYLKQQPAIDNMTNSRENNVGTITTITKCRDNIYLIIIYSKNENKQKKNFKFNFSKFNKQNFNQKKKKQQKQQQLFRQDNKQQQN